MKFKGIMPALVTPIKRDNRICEITVRKLIASYLEMGADGFYVCGATGEGIVLQKDERKKLCEMVIDEVKGRIPVINHVAAIDFATTIELAQHAEKSRCDCIAAIPPIYFNYSEQDIFNYYKTLAEAVHIPVMIYYHPATNVKMDAKLIAKIYEIDNVTAVKWSSMNYYEMMKLKEFTNGDMNIINGPDETLICGLMAGADGGIGSTYNIMLKEYKKLYGYFCESNIDEARKIQIKVNKVIDVIIKNNVIPTVKLALEAQGFDAGDAIYPMVQFSKDDKERILAELYQAGWSFA